MKIPKYSYKKIRRLYDEGFSILELSLMYWTTEGKVKKVLENDDTIPVLSLPSADQKVKA